MRFQQLLGLLQRIGNTVSKMDFLLTGGERGEVWGPVPDKGRVLRGLLSRPWYYGASSRFASIQFALDCLCSSVGSLLGGGHSAVLDCADLSKSHIVFLAKSCQ